MNWIQKIFQPREDKALAKEEQAVYSLFANGRVKIAGTKALSEGEPEVRYRKGSVPECLQRPHDESSDFGRQVAMLIQLQRDKVCVSTDAREFTVPTIPGRFLVEDDGTVRHTAKFGDGTPVQAGQRLLTRADMAAIVDALGELLYSAAPEWSSGPDTSAPSPSAKATSIMQLYKEEMYAQHARNVLSAAPPTAYKALKALKELKY